MREIRLLNVRQFHLPFEKYQNTYYCHDKFRIIIT
jgi:hypothetical protein